MVKLSFSLILLVEPNNEGRLLILAGFVGQPFRVAYNFSKASALPYKSAEGFKGAKPLWLDCHNLLIIPVKAIRRVRIGIIRIIIIGIKSNLLGPAGLFFLILSSKGRLGRLALFKASIVTAIIALGLDFARLLPCQVF